MQGLKNHIQVFHFGLADSVVYVAWSWGWLFRSDNHAWAGRLILFSSGMHLREVMRIGDGGPHRPLKRQYKVRPRNSHLFIKKKKKNV